MVFLWFGGRLVQQSPNNVIFIALLRMMQAVSDFSQLPDELLKFFPKTLVQKIKKEKPAKFQKMLDEFKEKKKLGKKIVIFTRFRGAMVGLKDALEKEGGKILTLSGEDSSKKRKEKIADFQTGKYDVFVVNLKAGNFGITLTRAKYVYIYDLWWNPQVVAQAIARVHRIGQEKDVIAYLMQTKGSIDDTIIKSLNLKKDLIEVFEASRSEVKSDKGNILEMGKKIFKFKNKKHN